MCITGADISATDKQGQTPLELTNEHRLKLADKRRLKLADNKTSLADKLNKVIDVLKHHM